eukprot:Sspe_Gene.54754::Locus_30183_Transcript_1_1_Confidence_1.000_Length_2767::g.54754::m.54754/K13302/SGK1; serum/glucocorticoid-regulated kinase 1
MGSTQSANGKIQKSKLHAITEEDREELRRSWALLKKAGEERVGHLHYSYFLQRGGNAARKLFAHTDLHRQRHVITPVVEWMLNKNLEGPALQHLGIYHANLGVTPEQLQVFAECFVDAVMAVLGDDGTPELRRRWEAAMGLLAEALAEEIGKYSKAITNTESDHSKEALKLIRLATLSTTSSEHLPSLKADHEGWLQISMYSKAKVKPPKKSGDHNLMHFRKRWVELRGQFVYYCKRQYDKFEGLIDLGMCELIDTSQRDGKLPSPSKFSFALQSCQNLDYPWYFVTDGDNDKEQWFVKLRKACNRFSLIRSDLYPGQRVRVWLSEAMRDAVGTCRWVGTPSFDGAEGLWVGIEMDTPVPEGHEGTVNGREYFQCDKGTGVLVAAHKVSPTCPMEIHVHGKQLKVNACTPAQFEFLTILGKGSFGRVCKVRERATGKVYACKVLQKAALMKESQITNIRREKSILLNISHPYIVKLHTAFQTHGRLFLLFDFLSGGELFHHVQNKSNGYLEEDHAKFYICEVALAISHLHSHNIIHRDLKAENLVLDAEGHCVLTDFGFAKTVLPSEHNTTKCGTLPYMAPEILQQGPLGYGFEVDWWALGVLLFLLLTGCYPFWHPKPRETVRQILYRVIDLYNFPPRPSLTETTRHLVCSLLVKDPSKRLASLEEFKAHPCLAHFDWDGCARRKIPPPFVPDQTGTNTKYFPLESLDDAAKQSRALPEEWTKSKADAFASFYDVHADYKLPEKASMDEDDEDFLNSLNNWEKGSNTSQTALLISSPATNATTAGSSSRDVDDCFILDT